MLSFVKPDDVTVASVSVLSFLSYFHFSILYLLYVSILWHYVWLVWSLSDKRLYFYNKNVSHYADKCHFFSDLLEHEFFESVSLPYVLSHFLKVFSQNGHPSLT